MTLWQKIKSAFCVLINKKPIYTALKTLCDNCATVACLDLKIKKKHLLRK